MINTTARQRPQFISPTRLITIIAGLLLLISVFLPWMSPVARLSSYFSSASGMNMSSLLGLVAIIGGGLVILLALGPFRIVRGFLHIIVGVAMVAVFGILMYNHTLPFLLSVVRSSISIGAGAYIYVLSALVVIIIGITELPKRRPRIRGRVAQAVPGICANCGTQANPGAAFCGNCGVPTTLAAPAAPVRSVQKVSWAWWLLPILLGVLGGIISFFAVLKRRPGMATAMLFLGIILTVVDFFVIRSFISNALSNFGFST